MGRRGIRFGVLFFCRPDGTFPLASGTAIPYNGEKGKGGGAPW